MIDIPSLPFDLGEDIDMLRDTVRAFAASEIAPRAAEIDRANEFPADLWRKFGRLGLLGITVGEEYGGTAWAISLISSRWRRSAAPPLRSGCPTARTPTCA